MVMCQPGMSSYIIDVYLFSKAYFNFSVCKNCLSLFLARIFFGRNKLIILFASGEIIKNNSLPISIVCDKVFIGIKKQRLRIDLTRLISIAFFFFNWIELIRHVESRDEGAIL